MSRNGLSLVEVVIGIALITILFGGIYLAYFSIIDVTSSSELRGAATAVLNREVEVIRNLPYDQVGTQGGRPSGVLLQSKNVSSSLLGVTFTVQTVIRNIDDPFDGTLGGTPNDTAPADYKLVELTVSCAACPHFVPLILTTTVAPKNLESASSDGSLFINIFDANAQSLSQVTVQVVNSSVTPSIDLIDTTNSSGVLQLVGVPTSTQRYAISLSRNGYSSDQTYLPGAPLNPNPLKPHATVAVQAVTQVSFAIDKVSTLNLKTSDITCSPIGNETISLEGSKKIGQSPDVLKFRTTTTTDSVGSRTLTNLEWDTYSFQAATTSLDLVGTIPLTPLIINPNTTVQARFVLTSSSPASLLVAIRDAVSLAGISSSTATLSKSGFSQTLFGGRAFLVDTDWSPGEAYSSQDGGIDATSLLGSLKLLSTNGRYSTTTTSWLISRTFDVGSSTSQFYTLNWLPAAEPPATGPDSVKFQIASNNDQATWNFLGPDGTNQTYYTTTGQTVNSLHSNNRYLRYKVYLRTADETVTPQVDEITLEFNSICVPTDQVLFAKLTTGNYTVTVGAPGYQTATTSVTVAGGTQQIDMLMLLSP